MALTKKKIDAASYEGDGKSWDVRYDGTVPGFGLRLFPGGTKTFILRYRTRTGRTRILTVGRYGTLTIDQAKKRARAELVRVTDGVDPVAERRKERREAKTVRELATTFIEEHAKPKLKTWKEHQRRLDSYVLPALGHLAVKDVGQADVAALHRKVGKRGRYEANRVLALVSVLFTQASELGSPLPAGHPNPAKGIAPFKEDKRDRWVKPAEMPKLAEAIAAEPNLYIRAVLWMYLLTGCRRSELLPRRWDQVDAERRELRLPDTKDGEPHVVPLSTSAWAVLESVPRQTGNPFIFCGHKHGTHLVNVAKAWRRIREAAGCADVRLHDLRRTVGSWMATSGASLQLIGAVLNHADTDTTRIYARLTDDAPRQALEEHGLRLMGVVNGNKKTRSRRKRIDPREQRIAELEAELARLRGAAS